MRKVKVAAIWRASAYHVNNWTSSLWSVMT